MRFVAPSKNGGWELDAVDASGDNLRTLARIGAADEASWSPDGQKFAFVVGDKLFVKTTARATPRLRAEGVYSGWLGEGNPAWSPDGKRIAYGGTSSGRHGIFVVSPTSGVPRRLTTNRLPDTDPTWSPDGRRVAFAHLTRVPANDPMDQPTGQLAIVDVVTGGVQLLGDATTIFLPSWAQGERVAYVGVWDGDGATIVELGTGFDPINLGFTPRHLAWSHDGKLLALLDPLASRVTIVRAGNWQTTEVQTQKLLPLAAPAWSPDNRTLAFVACGDENVGASGCGIYAVNSDGSHLHQITPFRASDSVCHGSFCPGPLAIAWVAPAKTP